MSWSHKIPLMFSLLAAVSRLILSAQTTITGTISDSQGQSLMGANIYLEGTYDGTTSNSNGLFTLVTDEQGNQILRIDFIGFESFKTEIKLDGTNLQLPLVKLKEVFNELNAVTISAGIFEAGDKKKTIVLSSIDMVTTAGSQGDVFGALKSLPGTTTVGESGKLFVKGGHSRESQTYIDGALVYVPYSSSSPNNSVRGRFNPFMFSGMMFSTGGYSAEFGQALSSVLVLQTNSLKIQDQLNISILSVGAELGGTKTWENTSLTSTLKYENLGPYMKLVPQYRKWEQAPQNMSADLSFRLKTGKSGMLKLYATANRSQLSIYEERLNDPGSEYNYSLVNDNHYINGSWIGEIAKDWILTTAFSYTRNVDDVCVDTLKFKEKLGGSHVKTTFKHRINKKIKMIFGTELFSKKYGAEIPSPERAGRSYAFRNNTLAGFLESELYASSKFVTRLGIRAEYSDYLAKSSLAPRISAAYKFNEKGQISLSYGWFFQDPEDEFLLYTSELSYERADHYTLNYILSKNRRVLRTELYYKDYKNLVKYKLEGIDEIYSLNNRGYGYAYGLDLFWRDRKSIPGGEYWVSYSYIDAKRDYRSYPHEAIPTFASKHNLTLVYKHWFNRLRSMAGATYRLSSPRAYNNPNSTLFNNERTIPYQSLDVNWSYLHKQNVIFYFSVSNLLGMKQEFGHKYATLPDSEGIFQSAPILPASKRFFVLGCFITLSRNGNVNQLDKIN